MSLIAKRFPPRRWSFLGPGSEKKWYSTNKERLGGKRDRVAELIVNGIHPAPDIHEHFMKNKGYGTLRISSRTTSTILNAL